MKIPLAPTVLLALCAAGFGAFAAVRAESQQANPVQLGFVDVHRVLREYKRRDAIEKDLVVRAEAAKKELKEKQAKLDERSEQFQTLAPDAPELAQAERELGQGAAALKWEGEFQSRRFERERNQLFSQLYNEIGYEVRVQAENRGLAAVFVNDPLPPGWEKNSDFLSVLRGRSVLWADGRLDLTQSVIDALNAKLPPTQK
jgi:Skp family chaperone for outer membrane proteins